MEGIKFEKVTFGTFLKFFQNNQEMMEYANAYSNNFENAEGYIKYLYDNIKLPERKTKHSAGYDIYSPVPFFNIKENSKVVLPSGIKATMPSNMVLKLYVRSSVGIKYDLELSNIVGIIDADYYNNPDNEGHILIGIRNNSETPYIIPEEKNNLCQGIFVNYFTTEDDNVDAERIGGVGSTN